jgi:translation elongation factor EF-1beta
MKALIKEGITLGIGIAIGMTLAQVGLGLTALIINVLMQLAMRG